MTNITANSYDGKTGNGRTLAEALKNLAENRAK